VLPILGRLDYRQTWRDNLSLDLGIGMGGYVLHSVTTSTEAYRYVQNSDPWREGDIQKNVFRTHLSAVTAGGEGLVALACEISRALSLGLTGRIIITSKVEDTWESSGYYPTGWDPVEPELLTVKNGFQYGGTGWGLGATISLWIP